MNLKYTQRLSLQGKTRTMGVILVLSLSLLLMACSGNGSLSAASPTQSPSAATQTNPTESPTQPQPPPPLTRLRLARAFPALSFERMTGLYEPPEGTARLFVLEQPGRVFGFENRQDVRQADLVLDITDRVNSSGTEEGLLGLAFAPDFASTGHFYLNYTAANPRRTVVSRFTTTQPARGVADRSSEIKVLEVLQPFANHNGGQIVFGPEGYLYIGMGDGGSAGDPLRNGQNLGVLLGKLLRIDVSEARPGRSYRIPPDNPFVGQEAEGVREEIWAYGLRNPWRFSFDPATGDLWLADVGQNTREEIDIIKRGANYGWNRTEGSLCQPATVMDCDKTGITLPVFEYPTSGSNCSITGGFVYRGELLPSIMGAYVYGDYCSGRIWGLRYDGARVTEHLELVDSDLQISSFALDRSGNFYALAHAARAGIYKLAP